MYGAFNHKTRRWGPVRQQAPSQIERKAKLEEWQNLLEKWFFARELPVAVRSRPLDAHI
jgi:hypothetical protein